MNMLGKDDILQGFRRIDQKAKDAGVLIDLSVYGGAALMLAFDVRRATRDVDAVVNGAPDFLRRVAAEVAIECGSQGVFKRLGRGDRWCRKRYHRQGNSQQAANGRVLEIIHVYPEMWSSIVLSMK